MVVSDILKVLYAPHKVFKNIVQNPKYLGPFLVLIIFVVAQVGSSYIVATKSSIEQTLPTADTKDVWTENAALWQANSGVTISENHVDFINATFYYNNTSIEFNADNSSSIQMALPELDGSVNCGAGSFTKLSFRTKIVTPSNKPENVTLYLYSLSDSDFFSYDLTPAFSNSSVSVWSNITIPVGSGGWASNGTPKWENITSLRMDFSWASASNIDLRVDGLFFRGAYKGFLDIDANAILINSALNAVTPFLFQWLLLTGLMWVMIKGLRGNATWKPIMVAVGLALLTLVVQAIIIAIVFVPLWPTEQFPLEVLAQIPGEYDVAAQVILNGRAQVNLVGSIVQVAVWVWLFALGTFIIRAETAVAPAVPVGSTQAEGEGTVSIQQFGWLKCMLVSVASLAITVTILGFLGVG